MSGLCSYEREVLRHIRAHGDLPYPRGAAVNQAAEVLMKSGLIGELDIGGYITTEKGRKELRPCAVEDLFA